MFVRYMCLALAFGKITPKFVCWFMCNINVEWSKYSLDASDSCACFHRLFHVGLFLRDSTWPIKMCGIV